MPIWFYNWEYLILNKKDETEGLEKKEEKSYGRFFDQKKKKWYMGKRKYQDVHRQVKKILRHDMWE